MQTPIGRPQGVFNLCHSNARRELECNKLSPFLYDHQCAALTALIKHFDDSNKIALVELPTGCGKTGIAVLAPYMLNATRVLVITPSLIVAKQMHAAFTGTESSAFLLDRKLVTSEDEFLRAWKPSGPLVGKDVGLQDAVRTGANTLVVTNVQKAGGASSVSVEDLPSDMFDLVIVDEAHHYPAPTWKNLIDRFDKARRIFLTATSTYKGKYLLGNAIGLIPEVPRCYTLSRAVAVEKGIIRPTNFEDVGDVGDDEQTRAKALAEAVVRALHDHDIQDASVQHKAMILAQTIDGLQSAQTVMGAFNEVKGLGYCKEYVGGTSEDVLKNFKSQNEPRVLIVVGRLLEGFDHKPVSVVGIHRNVAPASKVLFTQFVGRCVRKCNPDDPVTATVISHVSFKQGSNYAAFDKVTDVDPRDED